MQSKCRVNAESSGQQPRKTKNPEMYGVQKHWMNDCNTYESKELAKPKYKMACNDQYFNYETYMC